MSKKMKIQNLILIVFFVLVIFVVGFNTSSKSIASISKTDVDIKNIFQSNSPLQEIYRENVTFKQKFIDLYGLAKNTLQQNLSDNMQYIRDENGTMIFTTISGKNIESFSYRMNILKKLADEKDIPLLYMQIPSKVIRGFTEELNSEIDDDNDNIDDIIQSLKEISIEILDYRNYIGEGKLIEPENVYFKTDLHMTTQAEFVLLQILIDELETRFGISFNNKDDILDITNYKISSYPFEGNMIKHIGNYYAGKDIFDLYYPKFTTDMSFEDSTGNILRQGEFKNVVMNGYENSEYSKTTYWVLNYLQFETPRYTYNNNNNNNNNAPNILFITDSLSFRVAAYLSLLCNRLTIIDPRFDTGDQLLDELNSNEYDAIIFAQYEYLMGTNIILDPLTSLQAEIISHNTPSTINSNETYTINITVKNTGRETWSEKKQIRLCLWQNGIDSSYRAYIPDGVEIKPNEEYTFILQSYVAPSDDTYLEFQMLQEGIQYFGEREKKHDIQSMEQIDVSNIESEYPSEYAFYIDSAEYDSEGMLEILGWCIKQGKDYYPNVVSVLSDENNNYYKITTKTTNRSDVTTYFNDGNNYDSAGIYSIVKLKDLDQTYVLHLLVKDEDGIQYLVNTGININ